MRYPTILPVLFGLLFAAAPTLAAPSGPAPGTTSRYQASVLVADTSTANRSHAFAIALARVLAEHGVHSPSSQVLAQAPNFVSQYHYTRTADAASEPFRLVVQFAPAAIESLVRNLQQPAPVPAPATTSANPTAVAVVPTAGSNVVWVSGIASAQAFADVLAAFRHAPGVTAARVTRAQGNGMLVAVRASVPLARVVDDLEQGGHFVLSADATQREAAVNLHWLQ